MTRPISELITPQQEEEFRAEIANQGQREKSNEEIETEMRYKIHHLKSEIYCATQSEVQKRWTFEVEIKRPWFHYKPLDEAELVNWRKYLDFEQGEGDKERVVKLYERCLVACVCVSCTLPNIMYRPCMKSFGSDMPSILPALMIQRPWNIATSERAIFISQPHGP